MCTITLAPSATFCSRSCFLSRRVVKDRRSQRLSVIPCSTKCQRYCRVSYRRDCRRVRDYRPCILLMWRRAIRDSTLRFWEEQLSPASCECFSCLGASLTKRLRYTSVLGGLGSYLTIWVFLAISTINTLGKDFVSSRTSAPDFTHQMTIWHNLLALWLWRYLISAIEGITVPGVASLIGLVTHYLPSYFLWVTAFLFAMLVTKKTAGRNTVRGSYRYRDLLR